MGTGRLWRREVVPRSPELPLERSVCWEQQIARCRPLPGVTAPAACPSGLSPENEDHTDRSAMQISFLCGNDLKTTCSFAAGVNVACRGAPERGGLLVAVDVGNQLPAGLGAFPYPSPLGCREELSPSQQIVIYIFISVPSGCSWETLGVGEVEFISYLFLSPVRGGATAKRRFLKFTSSQLRFCRYLLQMSIRLLPVKPLGL